MFFSTTSETFYSFLMPLVTYKFLKLAHFNSEHGGSMLLHSKSSVPTYKTTGAHPEFFVVGGADTEAIYNLCLILETML
jgi:hypothetical protein